MKSYQKICFKKKIYGSKKKVAQILKEIHSQRKGEDSPGSFGFERTRKIN